MAAKPSRPRKLPRRQRRRRLAILLLLCCLGGGLAAVQPKPVESKPLPLVVDQDDTELLVVPVRAIVRGERLGTVEFRTMPWPKSSLSEQYIRALHGFENSLALTALPANLPVPRSALAVRAPELNAVVEGIPDGMRAITVRVDAESAVEGWARSGSTVDVIVLRQNDDPAVGIEAKVIAENVKVLSAGRSTEPLEGAVVHGATPGTITLLVSQADALKIKTAERVGRLTLSLRGAGDNEPTTAVRVDQRALLGAARRPTLKRQAILGTAKGPDGREYILAADSRWQPADGKADLDPSSPRAAAPVRP